MTAPSLPLLDGLIVRPHHTAVSVEDFDKAIELSPKTAIAFLNRGAAYEKLGDVQKALADYKNATELDSANEAPKVEAKRLQDQVDKVEASLRSSVREAVEREQLKVQS